jgi:crotonobetainyl-CoA:carnitine CoA-transferase CaiB-like acyl-CoA transferase
LFQRNRSGKGQVIEVNMLDAALVMMSPLVANALQAGSTDLRTGNVQTIQPGYAVFACKRGDIMIGAYSLAQHSRLFDALNLTELIEIPETIDKPWLRDKGDQIRTIILQRLSHDSAAHWEVVLNKADVPAARVRDLYEMLTGEQTKRARNSQFQRIAGSSHTAPIAAFRFTEDGPELEQYCARQGEDNATVFAELGYDSDAIVELAERGVI